MNGFWWELLIPATFIVLGCVFLSGRGAWLIAGYNTLPPSKRKKYDRRALCRFTGKMMFYVAGCLALMFIGDRLSSKALFVISMVSLFIGVVFMVGYANTGHRFERK
ncbi:MAG: DUF3784 domain-containing protein [Alistipes senegalensis]|nr:DUF3784 domain-containing protein [Bacteroides cellulosilyticus]MCM1351790.1 DUF3784 domain-containing protein [Alistipes senegalensis]